MVSNYVIANGRQVDIINRLLHEDSNATKEVIRLGQLVAERDAFLEHLYNDARSDTDEGYALRNAIELFWKEVNGGEGTDS